MNEESSQEEITYQFDEVKCIFCDTTLPSPTLISHHLPEEHNFPFTDYVQNLGMYDLIKFVNYWRTHGISEDVDQVIIDQLWDDDVYLKPVLQDDPLLYFNEEFSESFEDSEEGPGLDFDDLSREELIQRLKMLTKEAEQKDAQMEQAKEIIGQLQKFRLEDLKNEVEDIDLTVEDTYFQIYSSFKIHYDMLKDDIRTLAYRNFIYENKDYFKDKVVLDVGCGTGILTLFAASCGAKHVYAIDRSSVIHQAISISVENGLDDKITFIHSTVEDVETLGNGDKVDIIISEWMGYCLLYESMLPSVLAAKEKFLKPDGRVFPDVAEMLLCGISHEEWYSGKIGFWDDVYGFKMDTMCQAVLQEAHVDSINPNKIMTQVEKFKVFQINEIVANDLNFVSEFVLNAKSTTQLHALLCYFDILFEQCQSPVSFSTGPFTKDTHWGQSVFVLSEPIAVEEGDDIKITFDLQEKSRRERQLVVQLTIEVESKGVTLTQGYQIT